MSQIFISYSRQHPLYADRIEEDLLESGYSVWLDRKGIVGGEDWLKSIQKAIAESVVMLVIVTQEATESEYVQQEINIAQNLNKVCFGLIMERFQNPDLATKQVGLDNSLQHINFEQKGYANGYKELLRAIKQATDDWTHIQNIINTLGHFNPSVRKQGVKRLGETKDYRVVDNLIEAHQVENHLDVIEAICEAFSNYLDDNRVFSILVRYLASDFHNPYPMFPSNSDSLRTQAAKSLGLLDDDSDTGFRKVSSEVSFWRFDDQLKLTQLFLNDSNSKLKEYGCILSLMFIAQSNAKRSMIEYLIPLQTDENERVRFAATKSLNALGYTPPEDKGLNN